MILDFTINYAIKRYKMDQTTDQTIETVAVNVSKIKEYEDLKKHIESRLDFIKWM